MSRYYLMASLPMLTLGPAPAVSYAAFRAACGEQLGAGDVAELDALAEGVGQPASGFARRWEARETRLRNIVARSRAARRAIDPAPFLRPESGMDVALRQAVANAFARRTPAERELELDRIRWAALDELAGTSPFSIAAVFAYALKLKLCGKWAALDPESGRQAADAAVAALAQAGATPERRG